MSWVNLQKQCKLQLNFGRDTHNLSLEMPLTSVNLQILFQVWFLFVCLQNLWRICWKDALFMQPLHLKWLLWG